MKHKLKDPGSAITHFIGMLMAIFAATPLLIKAAREPDHIHVISLAIFIGSMILLYAASTLYHSLDLSEKINRRLRKLDHMMILDVYKRQFLHRFKRCDDRFQMDSQYILCDE